MPDQIALLRFTWGRREGQTLAEHPSDDDVRSLLDKLAQQIEVLPGIRGCGSAARYSAFHNAVQVMSFSASTRRDISSAIAATVREFPTEIRGSDADMNRTAARQLDSPRNAA
jgi:hypothetical protein